MSHFTVLVLHKKFEELDAILQPFHEYECTGIKDQYVVGLDEHDDVKHKYETGEIELFQNEQTKEFAFT